MDKKRELSKEEIELFDQVIRDLNLAIKNSVLYAEDHTIRVSSIQNLKQSLNKWLTSNPKLDLGITQDNVYLDGVAVKEEDIRYKELADYLHMRGVISLSFKRGIDESELDEFLKFIKHDRKTIRKEGGVLKNIPPTPHLEIKEIDYSALLVSAREKVTSDEDKVWESLFNVAEQAKGAPLPESKQEFLFDFFKNTKDSAKVLNKVYKEAVDSLTDEDQAEEIRDTISKICVYFEKYSTPESKDLKIKLMEVVSQLDPDLINILFEKTVINGENFDLADAITGDLSDGFIAEFIESLVSNEDTFNEDLLKVFDKLAPDAAKASNVVTMVADKLFQKRILNPETLSKLQMSIKEIFSDHPESDFMEQMHKITVDAVINKKIDTLVYVARLSPLINKFVQSMDEEKLKKEEIWLLLNILWLESSPAEFRKFSEKLTEIFPELLDLKDTERLREILEFFTEKMRPEQREDAQMMEEVKQATGKITSRETRDNIIAFIPEATSGELEDIAYMLISTGTNSAPLLIDAFIAEKNPAYRNNFRIVFSKMIEDIVKEVMERLEYPDPSTIRDLFTILREYDPEKAHLIARKLLEHKNAHIRWEALEVFEPETEEEQNAVFLIFKKERNEEVQKKAASVLLRTENSEVIDKVFGHTERNFFKRNFLLKLIELCGHMRSQGSFKHLRRIFMKKALFNTKRRDDLRVAAVSSLARLHTDEAMEIVKGGLEDKSAGVKKMCEIILKLSKGEEEEEDINYGEEDAGESD
ncbi:MAG: hypothetical protein ACE5JK_00380 [Candidatus Omnitrophota bacterium]